jgi:GPH family glycoside/pentoside/hexuronide:cation symporter
MMLISSLLTVSAKFAGISTIGGMLLFTFVYGIGSSAYWQLVPAMLYDICEYDELKTGKRREGSIVSLQSVAEALSQAAAMQLLGLILQFAGFNGEAPVQTPLALEWIENSLMVIPPVFMVLTAIMVFRYPISKKKFEEIRTELRKRGLTNG